MLLAGNEKGVYNSKLTQLYAISLHCIKLSEYIVRVETF